MLKFEIVFIVLVLFVLAMFFLFFSKFKNSRLYAFICFSAITVAVFGFIYYRHHYRNFNYSYHELYRIEESKSKSSRKKIVLKNLKDMKKYINDNIKPYPFIPMGKYKRLKGPIKIVFGVSGGNVMNLAETLGNVFYILRYADRYRLKYKIAVVLYGAMAGFTGLNYIKYHSSFKPYAKLMNREYKKGVKFYVCYNALLINHLIGAVILPIVKPVPMGALKIYELKKEGYIYITNP